MIALLWVVLLWIAMGHHRFYLAGDAAVNFRQHMVLKEGYFSTNAAAWKQRWFGGSDAEIDHVALLEGGFPIFLWAAGFFGERAPFMANAWVVSLLLLLVPCSAALTDNAAGRRYGVAALTGCLLLAYPESARWVWGLVLPYRDGLSHLFGFGALAVCLWQGRRGTVSPWWLATAGGLVGLSCWSRLTGILFAVPVGLCVMSAQGFGSIRQRAGALVWLGAGLAAGMLPILLQNIFEGRGLFAPPQAEQLLFRDAPTEPGSAVRKGWHPVNLPEVLPGVIHYVRNVFTDTFHALVFVGLLGWGIASGRRAVQLVPLFGGLFVFALFYGCYDKVVSRYMLVLVLFYSSLAALGIGWIIDRPAVLWPRGASAYRALSALLLAVALLVLAYRSEPDHTRARDEWADAQAFSDWLRTATPENALLTTPVQGLHYWRLIFGDSREAWTARLRRGAMVDPWRSSLPREPVFWLTPFRGDPDQFARGWMYDALLNRYDLISTGPPLFFRTLPFDGARLFQVRERGTLQRELEVESRGGGATHLYLYVRDVAVEGGVLDIVFTHQEWSDDWSATLRSGANLIAIPQHLDTRPSTIRIRSDHPLPTWLDAFWMGAEAVRVPMSVYRQIYSRLLNLEGVSVRWSGYARWWRDWGAHSARHQSFPRVILNPDSRIRIPHRSGLQADTIPLHLRLYGTWLVVDSGMADRIQQGMVRLDDGPPSDASVSAISAYDHYGSRATDFILEWTLDPVAPDHAGPAYLTWAFPSEGIPDGEGLLYLHAMEYQWARESSPAPNPYPDDQWLRKRARWRP